MATVAGAKRRYREYVTEFNKKFSAMKLEICQAKKTADRERIGEQMQELVDEFTAGVHKEGQNLFRTTLAHDHPGVTISSGKINL
jgi:hypothetical protein